LRPGELERALAVRQVLHPDLVGIGEEGAGHLGGIGVAVGFLVVQDVPDRHQQLACDRDDRFRAAEMDRSSGENGFPGGMDPRRLLGSCNHHVP
jgi:hypothetical protein